MRPSLLMKSYKQLMASERGRVSFLYGGQPLTDMHMINSKWIQKGVFMHTYIYMYIHIYTYIYIRNN